VLTRGYAKTVGEERVFRVQSFLRGGQQRGLPVKKEGRKENVQELARRKEARLACDSMWNKKKKRGKEGEVVVEE